MNDCIATLSVAEMFAEVADERINPDTLDGCIFRLIVNGVSRATCTPILTEREHLGR